MTASTETEISEASGLGKTLRKEADSVWRNLGIWLLSLLGAIGTGWQNYEAFLDFLLSITRFSWELVQGMALSFGGFCSAMVNHCINVDLLNAFAERVSPVTEDGKTRQQERRQYHAKLFGGEFLESGDFLEPIAVLGGAAIFIITGILYGLTAYSFGPLNVIGILAIAASIFIAIIISIQELETWLSAFDPQGKYLYVMQDLPATWDSRYHEAFILIREGNKNWADCKLYEISESGVPDPIQKIDAKVSLLQEILGTEKSAYVTVEEVAELTGKSQEKLAPSWRGKLIAWFKHRTLGHWLGTLIALGNMFASGLFFTTGLASFLLAVGVPIFPALIIGLCIAFTIGAFTEFYFYNYFLASFCAHLRQHWQALIHSQYWGFGLCTIVINGVVNGALSYSSVLLLGPLFAATGLAVPLIPFAIVAGIFGGLASMFLGSDFWIRNWQTIINAVSGGWNWLCGKSEESLQGARLNVFEPNKSIDPRASESISTLSANINISRQELSKQPEQGRGAAVPANGIF